ncbi:hypothetical protein [Prescottella subtropica]|uniref:hypothetical protein n=1 Tax=Prescottella subtropica TaxID=2545757 RepID=UPI0010F6D262|nr:hypothetical protein [Prescottella subtropica]
MSATNPFALKRPCRDCPFRADRPTFLRPDRATEIADGLAAGQVFHCHKTVDYTDTDGDSTTDTSTSVFCAGALSVFEADGEPNNAMRVGQRLGLYDPDTLADDVPVYPSLADWVASHHLR